MPQQLRTASVGQGSLNGRRFRPPRPELLAFGSVLALLFTVMALHVHDYQRLSPIDELHHVDYMIKAAHGQLLRRGDVIGPETRREGSCRSVDAPGYAPGSCGDEAWLAGREFNTEEIQPPAYYFVTGWVARALRPLLGTSSLVAVGRMVGALWAAAGVATLWAALALLGTPVLARWAVAVLVITTPVVLHASTTVSNDATGLLAGGGMLLAALAWEKRRAPAFVVVLATFAGVSLRLTNFAGAGLVAVYLVLRALRPGDDTQEPERRSSKSSLLMAAGVVGTVLVTGLAWVTLNSAVARVGPLANPNTFNQQVDHLSLEMVLGQMGAAVTPIHDPYLVPFLRISPVRAVIDLTNWLVLGAAVGLAAFAYRGSRGEAIGASTFVCAAATGPVITVTNYVFQGAFYAIPPRYGLSLVPAFAVALALSSEKAWARVAITCLAGTSALLVLVAELR